VGIPGFVPLTAALCVLGPPAFAAPPVEAFGRLPTIVQADLSPSGEQVVAVIHVNGAPVIGVLDTNGGAWRVVGQGEDDASRLQWCRFKTERRILCSLATTVVLGRDRFRTERLFLLDADGSRVRRVARSYDPYYGFRPAERVVSMLDDDPNGVLVQLCGESTDAGWSVFRMDVATGHIRAHTRGFSSVGRFHADPDGVVRLAKGASGQNLTWWGREGGGQRWRELARYQPLGADAVEFVGFGAKPAEFYMLRDHAGRKALWLADLGNPRNPRLLFSHPEFDVEGPVLWNDRVVGVAYQGDRPEIRFLDEDAQALFAMLKRTVPGSFPELVDRSADGNRLLVRASADRQPPVYLLVDRDTGRSRVIARAYPDLGSDMLSAMNGIHFPARDGARVPGYLTLPAGRPPKGLSLVVLPHDGLCRDQWTFDFFQQFLVSRGYAVLQPEYRGTCGYGDAWYRAAHHAWGDRDYDDVVDGVHWAIERGIADPARVAIAGWGRGGYLALLGAARDPDLFRVVISIAGITDLQGMVSYGALHFTDRLSFAREAIGTDVDRLAAYSPARHAGDIGVPVLLFHGAEDAEVPVEQSRLMSAALEHAGKPHELVEFENESHQIDHEENRIGMLRRIEAFLAAHLGSTEGKE